MDLYVKAGFLNFLDYSRYLDAGLDKISTTITVFPTSDANATEDDLFKKKKWHSESADPAKAFDLSLAKQTNKLTNKKSWPHRGSNSRPSRL